MSDIFRSNPNEGWGWYGERGDKKEVMRRPYPDEAHFIYLARLPGEWFALFRPLINDENLACFPLPLMLRVVVVTTQREYGHTFFWNFRQKYKGRSHSFQ